MYTDLMNDSTNPAASKSLKPESLKPESLKIGGNPRPEHVKKPPVTLLTKAQVAQLQAGKSLPHSSSTQDTLNQSISNQTALNKETAGQIHLQDNPVFNSSKKNTSFDYAYFSVQDLIVGYDDTIIVNGLSLHCSKVKSAAFWVIAAAVKPRP